MHFVIDQYDFDGNGHIRIWADNRFSKSGECKRQFFERTEIASDGYGKSFSRCGELLVIPQVKNEPKRRKNRQRGKAETESLLLSAHPERHELSLGIYQPKSG